MLQGLRLENAEGSKEGSQVFRFSVAGLRLVKAEGSKGGLQVYRFSVAGSETCKG